MKKIFIIVLILLAKTAFCQDNAVDKFYKGFQAKHSLAVATVSSQMLPLLIDGKKGKEKEALTAIINKLTGLKVIYSNNPSNGDELFSAANALLPKQYGQVLTIEEKDRKVQCYTLGGKKKATELVMIAFQWGRFMVLSITGDIELEEIYRLSRSMNFSSLGGNMQ